MDGLVEHVLGRVYRTAGGVLLLSVPALILWGAPRVAANAGLGIIVSAGVVRSTQMLVQRYLTPGERLRQQRRQLMMLMLAKLPVLMIVFFLVVRASWFHPGGFILGLSVVPALLVLYGGAGALKAGR